MIKKPLHFQSDLVLQNLPQLCLFLTPDFNILDASNAYLNAALTKREDIIGRCIFEVFPENPETPEANAAKNLKSSLETVLSSKKEHALPVQHYDIRNMLAKESNFETRYWKALNTPVLDNKGEVKYIIHCVEDVTDEILTQDELHTVKNLKTETEKEAKKLSRLLDQAPLTISILKGAEHRYEFVNEKHKALLNRDVTGQTILEIFPEIENQGITKLLDEVYESGKPCYINELRIELDLKRTGAAKECYYNVIYHPVFDENGACTSVMAMSIDITEQIKSRKIIEENAKWVEQILETIPNIAWTAKRDGICCDYVNKRFVDYTGIDFYNGSNIPWEKFTHPDDIANFKNDWESSIETGQPFESEVRLRSAAGEYNWFLVRAMPKKNNDGEIIGWIGTSTDIHIKKMIREKLVALSYEQKNNLAYAKQSITRVNEEVDQFAFTVSHDLKEPLRMIMSYTNLLGLKYANILDEDASLFMKFITDNTHKMGMLLEGMHLYSTIGRELNSNIEKVNCNEIVREVELKLLAETGKDEIITTYQDLPTIEAAKSHILKLFYNLIDNAVRFKSEVKPQILITATEKKTEWLFAFEDNGCGFDPQYNTKAFTIFQKLHDNSKSGLGVGLAICKKIVNIYGGDIWVEKSKKSGGMIFYFTLSRSLNKP